MMRKLLPAAARVRALAGDERGTSVIELAFVAPILSLLTMGIVDLSGAYARRMELTQAASRTLERLAADEFDVPQDANGEPVYTGLQQDAATAAGVPTSKVTVIGWLECDGVEQADGVESCPADTSAECSVPTPPADCEPVMARYVQVRIEDSFDPMFGSILSTRADGTYPLWVEAAMRVE